MSKTKAYYDGIAKGYKELYHEEQIGKISLVASHFPQSGNVLDLGSADGVLNSFLNKSVSLTSFDLSTELLKLNSNKTKVQGSIEKLPFDKESFDYILSFTVLQDVENIEKAIKEINRVLKKDGTLIISFLKMSKKKDLILEQLEKHFEIEELIEEEKDLILILTK